MLGFVHIGRKRTRTRKRKRRRFDGLLVFLLYYSHKAKAMSQMNGFMTHFSNVQSDVTTGFYPFHPHCIHVLLFINRLQKQQLWRVEF